MSSGHRYEELPRTIRLTDGARLDRENVDGQVHLLLTQPYLTPEHLGPDGVPAADIGWHGHQ